MKPSGGTLGLREAMLASLKATNNFRVLLVFESAKYWVVPELLFVCRLQRQDVCPIEPRVPFALLNTPWALISVAIGDKPRLIYVTSEYKYFCHQFLEIPSSTISIRVIQVEIEASLCILCVNLRVPR